MEGHPLDKDLKMKDYRDEASSPSKHSQSGSDNSSVATFNKNQKKEDKKDRTSINQQV